MLFFCVLYKKDDNHYFRADRKDSEYIVGYIFNRMGSGRIVNYRNRKSISELNTDYILSEQPNWLIGILTK